MIRRLSLPLFAGLLALPSAIAAKPAPADMAMWRLDCGAITIKEMNFFSDSFAYPDKPIPLTASCYLIRHGQDYMLWDAGLPLALLGKGPQDEGPGINRLDKSIADQLKALKVDPASISRIGISHLHWDHTGQLPDFPQAELLIGAADVAQLRRSETAVGEVKAPFAHWLSGRGKLTPVSGDKDIFGDGSVVMMAMPGHTHGETALLVRLPQTGAVLLSGDVVHFREQLAHDGVPPLNDSRADSVASLDRLKKTAAHLNARLIIQHDMRDIDHLPRFPQAAR